MKIGDLVYMTTCNDRRIKGIIISHHSLPVGEERHEVFIFKSAVTRWFFEKDLIKFE